MIRRAVAIALIAGLAGCDDRASFLPVDLLAPDDDDTAADDDDATPGDDDDATGDDDDATGDDDDATGDDDDATEPPAELGATYCLDWSSVNVTDPPGIWELLTDIGAALDDSPPILVPSGVDPEAGRIWIDAGVADDGCVPEPGTVPLDGPDGGLYAPPHFESGPGTLTLGGGDFALALQDALVTGDFSPSADRIANGTIAGALDLSSAFGACALLPCGPCPHGGDQCVGFAADSAVWHRAD